MQIQDHFEGRPLAELASAGLDIYDLIPNYRHECPLCGGAGCAVRHGLYHRQVIDHGSIYERFPVPRFRCRRRGPRKGKAVTFSVLPTQLLPRKRPSLSLAAWMLHRWLVAQLSLAAMLDELADSFHRHRRPWLPEVSTVYRLLRLFALARLRLEGSCAPPPPRDHPGRATLAPSARKLTRAKEDARLVLEKVRGRGSPAIEHYHRRDFSRLLFAPLRSHKPL